MSENVEDMLLQAFGQCCGVYLRYDCFAQWWTEKRSDMNLLIDQNYLQSSMKSIGSCKEMESLLLMPNVLLLKFPEVTIQSFWLKKHTVSVNDIWFHFITAIYICIQSIYLLSSSYHGHRYKYDWCIVNEVAYGVYSFPQISEGAECIFIPKKLFQAEAPTVSKQIALETAESSYPTKNMIRDSDFIQQAWTSYKIKLIEQHLDRCAKPVKPSISGR